MKLIRKLFALLALDGKAEKDYKKTMRRLDSLTKKLKEIDKIVITRKARSA